MKREKPVRPVCWHDGLTTRARNCLINFGINSLEDLRQSINNDTLHYKNRRPGNFGEKTYFEVCKFAGVKKKKPEVERCPRCGQVIREKRGCKNEL